jgi:hypothetical protein
MINGAQCCQVVSNGVDRRAVLKDQHLRSWVSLPKSLADGHFPSRCDNQDTVAGGREGGPSFVERHRVPHGCEHESGLGGYLRTGLRGTVGAPGGKATHEDTDFASRVAQVDVELADGVGGPAARAEVDQSPHDGCAGGEDIQHVEGEGQADAGLARVRRASTGEQADACLQGRIHQAGMQHEACVDDRGW